MSEVFISYSRSDSNFVHQLHSALEKSQREAWVDWENIPTSADWWREICEGIEAADTFIFVISPASVASPVCNLEVGYAIEHNKRFIPVVRAKTNEREAFAVLATHSLDDHLQTILAGREILAIARDNWQAMARHNWLLFTEDADFENTFQKLIEVINTDLEHVRHHTRLLVRAREWENKNKNGAFLLRGEDLKEAEKWLAQSGNKIPNPTKLQTPYIFASRQAANGRQRSLLSSVSAALLISLSLAALSFALFRQSEERSVIAGQNAASATVAQGLAQQEANNRATQQNLAESNAVTAQANLKIALNTQSQFLADLSRQQLDQDQVLPARLLALEGMANYPQVYHQENLNSLINAYYKPGAEVMSFSHPGVGGVLRRLECG